MTYPLNAQSISWTAALVHIDAVVGGTSSVTPGDGTGRVMRGGNGNDTVIGGTGVCSEAHGNKNDRIELGSTGTILGIGGGGSVDFLNTAPSSFSAGDSWSAGQFEDQVVAAPVSDRPAGRRRHCIAHPIAIADEAAPR